MLEHAARRIQLEPGAVVVAESAAGQSNLNAHPRRQIRRLCPLPSLKSAAQRTKGCLRVALGKRDRPAGVRGDRFEHVRAKALGDHPEFAGRTARRLDIARSQHDLDIDGQEPRTLQPIAGSVQNATHRGRCCVRATLCKPQQSEARLRLPSPLARHFVRVFGCRELAPKSMDLRLLIECRGRSLFIGPVGEALARAARLFDCIWPGAVQLHDLRAMHKAPAGENQIGLLLAPFGELGSPVTGPAHCVYLLAAIDDAAIDQAGDHGRQFARRDHHHCFVQQCQSPFDPPLMQPGSALEKLGGGDQLCFCESFAEFCCFGRAGKCRIPVTGL
ncbi:MAG: hypothetical protein GEU91_23855 [Rhizobiales bacterium]|nr:hypothetical protein [Hyphomicrobiales bacterium]